MIKSNEKWVVAVGWGNEGDVVVIDSSNFKTKTIKLFRSKEIIIFLEIIGNLLWMGLVNGGIRVAEMNEQGNVKPLENVYLKGKTVSQLHNLSEDKLIAFVDKSKDIYVVDK